jgi:hypothetical protein
LRKVNASLEMFRLDLDVIVVVLRSEPATE